MSENYKWTRNWENLQRANYEGLGKYGIPRIRRAAVEDIDWANANWLGCNFMRGCEDPEDHVLHFFTDDYQFMRFWTDPDRYIPKLKRFKAVVAPDFSGYADWPAALNIYNHYRKHWLARYWQENGVNVIPCINWVLKDSFDWCFDGEPVGGPVVMSIVGWSSIPKERRATFADGYNEMMARLKPETIVIFGRPIEECWGNTIYIKPFHDSITERKNAKKLELLKETIDN